MTPYEHVRETEHARARGIEDGLGVGGVDGGGVFKLATLCSLVREEV